MLEWYADKRPGFGAICNRLRRIKGFLITDSYDGVEELLMYEVIGFQESMDQANEGVLEQDMPGPDSYFILSQDAAQRIFDLTSASDEHPSSSTDVSSLLKTSHLNKMQCDLLVQYVRNSMDEVKKQMRSNPESASLMTLTEYYRIVIACEKLILQCCNQNWQTAAIWVMDCKATFFLRISELLWCTAIIAQTTWQGAAFTERIDVVSQRLSDCAEEDRRLLKDRLEIPSMVDSRYVSGDLVTYLSRRADAKGDEVVECPRNLLADWGNWITPRVFKATMFNESVAIKKYWQSKDTTWVRDMATSEASVMAKLNHPGSVPLVGVSSAPDSDNYLIMELMSGDLMELLTARFISSLHVCVDIMLQIAEAMQHVHNAGLVHRDLRPTHILFKVVEDEHLSKAGFVVVKVAGFRLAIRNREWELSENLEGDVGTSRYMAPELFRAEIFHKPVRLRNSNIVDVYSFSMVCYEIISGKLPFDSRRISEIGKCVRDGERPILPATCPRLLASLIEQCWASDPNSRPNFERICWVLRHIKTMLITGSSSSINFL